MGWGWLIDLIFGMVVVDVPIKLSRKFKVDPKTQTHFLSDLFFLIVIRPVVGIYNHNLLPPPSRRVGVVWSTWFLIWWQEIFSSMVVVDAQIKLPRKFQVDPKTQTHFLSDLFFLIAIRPVYL